APAERKGPPQRAVRPAVDLRAGRHGLRHGSGAPLMPPGPAVRAALTWELADGAVAVVTFDLQNESVNKISRTVKDDVLATLAALEGDRAVQAVAFFSGKRDNFIAGADIEEFVRLTTAAEAERLSADGQELLDRVARFPKPIAVGIHGACLGGGLEFALACHYRVASDHGKTQLGLPEVQLGILPGAGGARCSGRRASRCDVRREGLIPRRSPRSKRWSTACGAACAPACSAKHNCSGSSPCRMCPANWCRSFSRPRRSRRTSGSPIPRRPVRCSGWESWARASWDRASRARRSRRR